jgi:hypothetical protein
MEGVDRRREFAVERSHDAVEAPKSDPFVAARLNQLVELVQGLSKLTAILAARSSDSTHLSVVETAKFLGLSERTIRDRIKRGEFRCEVVPGTRRKGISTVSLFSDWIDSREFARRLGAGREGQPNAR